MALNIQESERIADGVLPVAQLARQMRLPEDFDTIPGHAERLRMHLRAAASLVETRTGQAIGLRRFVLSGVVAQSRALRLPVSPIIEVETVAVEQQGSASPVSGWFLTSDRAGRILRLGASHSAGTPVTVTLRAGYSSWDAVPPALGQAILLLAETLESGETVAESQIGPLLSPFRQRRIGGVC